MYMYTVHCARKMCGVCCPKRVRRPCFPYARSKRHNAVYGGAKIAFDVKNEIRRFEGKRLNSDEVISYQQLTSGNWKWLVRRNQGHRRTLNAVINILERRSCLRDFIIEARNSKEPVNACTHKPSIILTDGAVCLLSTDALRSYCAPKWNRFSIRDFRTLFRHAATFTGSIAIFALLATLRCSSMGLI